MQKIRLAGIYHDSVVDGPGIRLVLFTQGCLMHCPGCQNPETWHLEGGKLFTIPEILAVISDHDYVDGVTFSGGEPFLQAQALSALGEAIREKGKNIVTYTGLTFEEILKNNDEGWRHLLKVTDLLIDGPFKEDLKDLALPYRGSANQRLINVPQSLETGKVIIRYI